MSKEHIGPPLNQAALETLINDPVNSTYAALPLVPGQFIFRARRIVEDQRPDGLPQDFDPVMQLSRKDEKALDSYEFRLKTDEEKQAILASLRAKYAGDSTALTRIDLFDPNSELYRLNKETLAAYRAGNKERVEKIQAKKRKKYPDYEE